MLDQYYRSSHRDRRPQPGLAAVLLLLVLTASCALGSIAAAQARESELRLLALGDSLTAGYGLDNEASFPAQLQAALRGRGLMVTVINAGVSGDTSSGGLARLDWALADQPDAVIIELGANDGLRAVDPEVTRNNLAAMLTALRDKGLPVLLTGMLAPPNLGPDYEADFNTLYPQLAEQFQVPLYPFFLDGVATQNHLNQADRIHPNAAGVAVIVERILPYVIRLLESVDG